MKIPDKIKRKHELLKQAEALIKKENERAGD